jgi:hypothetical protein
MMNLLQAPIRDFNVGLRNNRCNVLLEPTQTQIL